MLFDIHAHLMGPEVPGRAFWDGFTRLAVVQTGRSQERVFENYHRVLNRAKWSSWVLAVSENVPPLVSESVPPWNGSDCTRVVHRGTSVASRELGSRLSHLLGDVTVEFNRPSQLTVPHAWRRVA